MKTSKFAHAFTLLAAGLCALALVSGPATAGQSGADEALAKKYSPILGGYELDLTAVGGGLRPTDVVVRDGKMWVDDGDGRPVEIKPVGDSGLEFEAQDERNGYFTVTFIKNDLGAVVKMRLVMPDQGLDVSGNKVK
jgi:hypothetical protein